MDDNEWAEVKRQIFLTFPVLATWAKGLDPDPDASGKEITEGREAMNRRWRSVLGKETLEHALRAIDMLAAQPEPPWKYVSQYEQAAGFIADVCRTFRPSMASPPAREKVRKGQYIAQNTFKRVSDAIARDTRHSVECNAQRSLTGRCARSCGVWKLVADEINAEPSNLTPDRESYRCWSCRDTGWVSCLKWARIVEVVEQEVPPLLNTGATFACYCNCSKGEAIIRTGDYPAFDASTMVVAAQPFRDLLSACRAALDNARNLTHKRESSFDAFNNQPEDVLP